MDGKNLNNQNPDVSVILPSYNRQNYISRAIESVLNQTYKNFELIVVDDASEDDTPNIVSKFNDIRIKYIRFSEQRGAAFARNEGIKIAKGKFIAFQDSDDEWLPDKLQMQIEILNSASDKVGVAYSMMLGMDNNNQEIRVTPPRFTPEDKIIYKQALAGKLMGLGLVCSLIRKSCFDKAGMFDERFKRFIDLDLFIRISRHYYFCYIDKPLIRYSISEDSVSKDLESLVEAQELILKKYYQDIREDEGVYVKYLYEIGTLRCQLGKTENGRDYLLKALKVRPLNLKAMLALLVSFLGNKSYLFLVKMKRKFKKI